MVLFRNANHRPCTPMMKVLLLSALLFNSTKDPLVVAVESHGNTINAVSNDDLPSAPWDIEKVLETDFEKGQKAVRFEAKLEKGSTQISGRFITADGKVYGSYYMTVRLLGK